MKPPHSPSPLKVVVIGTGLSASDLTANHLDIIRGADILVGGSRHLAEFGDHPGLKMEITRRIPELTAFIREHYQGRQVVVLASGDPLLSGIGATLVDALGRDAVEIHPNVSSVAAAFARIKEPWQDARIISLHGKNAGDALRTALREAALIAVLTDPVRNPAWIAGLLLESGADSFRICVLEQLGSPDEKVTWLAIEEAAHQHFAEPNVVVLKRSARTQPPADLYPGMPDDAYDHEKGLITKPEIRAVSLAKLKLLPRHVLWDLGAGSGSVGIEASRFLPLGKVVAVEKKPERIRDMESNRRRYGVMNMEIRQATLPEGLSELPPPDRIFIGGGGRALPSIIRSAARFLKPDGIMVLNTVLVDNLAGALATLREMGFAAETVQVQISRSKDMPWSSRFEAQNPVWIISAARTSGKAEG